jgi:hypothetical protein
MIVYSWLTIVVVCAAEGFGLFGRADNKTVKLKSVMFMNLKTYQVPVAGARAQVTPFTNHQHSH